MSTKTCVTGNNFILHKALSLHKAMTAGPTMMHVELQATCAALGYYEGDVYHKEPDCLGEYTSVCILYSVIRIVNNSFAFKAGVNSFMAK